MRAFLSGATAALCLVAALFFLRFWRQSRDRLYVFFALAFALLAANGTLLAFVPPEYEARAYLFVVRLVAFVLILVAIVDKNRAGR